MYPALVEPVKSCSARRANPKDLKAWESIVGIISVEVTNGKPA
jgi:hypothetical protein